MSRATEALDGFFEERGELINHDFTDHKLRLEGEMFAHLQDVVAHNGMSVDEAEECFESYRATLWGKAINRLVPPAEEEENGQDI